MNKEYENSSSLGTFINTLFFSSRFEQTFSCPVEGASKFLSVNASRQNQKPFLVIVENFETARTWLEDLCFYRPDTIIDFFPHWDIPPYDNLSPDKSVLAERFRTLANLLHQKSRIVITTPNALMQKIMPPAIFMEHSFLLEQEKQYEREELYEKLTTMGYVRVETVEEEGEFSVRGGIVDLYPLGYEKPVRMDFFDNELESIKEFDVETQRSHQKIEQVLLLPGSEVILNPSMTDQAVQKLKSFRKEIEKKSLQEAIEAIQNQVLFPGIQNLMPVFFSALSTLIDYFPVSPLVVYFEKSRILDHSREFYDEIAHEFEFAKEQGNLALSPEELFLSPLDIQTRLDSFQSVHFTVFDDENADILPFADNLALRYPLQEDSHEPVGILAILKQFKQWHSEGARIAIAVRNHSEGDKLNQIFQEIDSAAIFEESFSGNERLNYFTQKFDPEYNTITLMVGNLSQGFRFIDEKGSTRFALISAEEIFGPRMKQHRVKKSSLKQYLSALGSLQVGDYIVHLEHGIGKYEGLEQIQVGGYISDFLVLSFYGGDKVCVPVDKFHLVQKYAGSEAGSPRINKLGDKAWSRAKSKVRVEVQQLAEDLVKLYAKRKAKKGYSFTPEANLLDEFALSFPYQETEDQLKAIQDVYQDVESSVPMDRLVCGDVGFGKTEVAIRASFRASFNGYQTAVLTPTTILAQQHYETFQKRFQRFPIQIGLLSRFRTPKQIEETLRGLKEERIDIVIGTHRLLSKDIEFKNLGLLVIDEEQRFGVKHKERIKQYRAMVHVLALSATPIPRTLHLSLLGIRDISLINTPPMDRRSIRTRVLKTGEYIIQEAVHRELRRSGQVFFIHNRVESIYQIGNYLQNILPKVRIGIAHGQMSERELERVMIDFIEHKTDLLLATTIVESGLDIPNANTMIINHADQFGLAQLYQLRGRVGRSDQQAYAYLLIPRDKAISTVATKRLTALKQLTDLGSGYKIASHDLEIRGAGDVLGAKQSGHIAAIGYDLYVSMVEEEVKRIQDGETQVLQQDKEVKIDLAFPLTIPETYIESINQRLDIYKSIASCVTEDDLWNIRASVEDRFGILPEEVVNLFHSTQIKLIADKMKIVRFKGSSQKIELMFSEQFQPSPEKLLGLAQQFQVKFYPDYRIEIFEHFVSSEKILHCLKNCSKHLGIPID